MRVRVSSGAEESSPTSQPTGTLRPGYRVFHLRSPLGTRLEACFLFVHISAGVEPNSWVSGMAIQKQLEDSEARILRLEAQMKRQVARQFNLMAKQLKLSRDGGGELSRATSPPLRRATARAELSRATSSDLAQAAPNPRLLERTTTNPGLFESRALSDARTASEDHASSEHRASLPNRSGEAAADAAATDACDLDGSHWPHGRAASCCGLPRRQAAPAGIPPGASPAVGLPPGTSTREQALARSRNARGPMQQAVSGIDGINLSLPWPSTAAASTTSASCSVDAGLSGTYRSQEMWKRVKASVGHARVTDSPKPVFTRSNTRDLVLVARAAARGRHEIDTTSEAFSSPFTGLAQALHRPAGAPAAAASAPASAAGELQLSGLSLQRTVGCRAPAPAAAATRASLKAAGNAVLAGHRMQRLGALRAPPPEGWPPMEGAPAGDDKAAREAARSWLSKLEDDLLAGNSL